MTGHSVPGALAVAVRPERGAKITSLRDANGTEWLTQSELRTAPPLGTSFVDAEMAGWDECAPTIDPCVVSQTSLPDHGDAWDAVWASEDGTLVHRGTSLPYRLQREITRTAGGGLRLSYRATTDAPSPVPFLWAAHPQFAAPPGTRVEFDRTPRHVVDVHTTGRPELDWADELGCIDTVAPGESRKLYVQPDERVGSVTLVRPGGARLHMTLGPTIPYLGLWFDNGAWAPGPVIALEPALAYADSLATAVHLGTAPFLTRRSALTWWIELHRH